MVNTTLCYIEKNGAYLMLHRTRRKDDYNGGKWIGVGGHCEGTESPDECIRREILEETGLSALSCAPRGLVTFVDGDYCEYMHLYTCASFSGDIRPCDEGELVWVKKEEVPALPVWEGDRIFLKLLSENAPFFELKLTYENGVLAKAVLNGKSL